MCLCHVWDIENGILNKKKNSAGRSVIWIGILRSFEVVECLLLQGLGKNTEPHLVYLIEL